LCGARITRFGQIRIVVRAAREQGRGQAEPQAKRASASML
jgi:hypothetical protein